MKNNLNRSITNRKQIFSSRDGRANVCSGKRNGGILSVRVEKFEQFFTNHLQKLENRHQQQRQYLEVCTIKYLEQTFPDVDYSLVLNDEGN